MSLHSSELIVNGRSLKKNELPSIVRIENDDQFATGIVLGSNSVLIAGHSISIPYRKDGSYQVKIKSDDSEKIRELPVKIVTHYEEKKFKAAGNYKWEAAILIFPENTFPKESAAAISLEELKADDSLEITGYGPTDLDEEKDPDRPQIGNAKLLGVHSERNQGVIIAENQEVDAFATAGDSGGGVFKNKKLVGVIMQYQPDLKDPKKTKFTGFAALSEPLALNFLERAQAEGAEGLSEWIDALKKIKTKPVEKRIPLFTVNEKLLKDSSTGFKQCQAKPQTQAIEEILHKSPK